MFVMQNLDHFTQNNLLIFLKYENLCFYKKQTNFYDYFYRFSLYACYIETLTRLIPNGLNSQSFAEMRIQSRLIHRKSAHYIPSAWRGDKWF